MIRIELRDAKNHVLLTKDFHGEEIRIGRGLDCDLILPDLELRLHEKTLRASELRELQTTLVLGRHKLKIYNLAMYAQAPQRGAGKTTVLTWMVRPELRRLWAVMLIIFGLLMLDQLYLSPTDVEIWKIVENVFAVFIGTLVLATLLSVLSRALHGEYRVLKLYEWTLWVLLGFAAVSQDFYNLRWLLPSVFKYSEIYAVFFVVWFSITVWSFLALIFEQLSPRARGLIVALIVIPIIVVRSFDYIPSRKKHHMLHPQTSPPRPELIESRPVDTDTFLKTLGS